MRPPCYIDEEEVYDYSKNYEDYIGVLNLEDTPQNFANYIMRHG